jgi:hypothetical protein
MSFMERYGFVGLLLLGAVFYGIQTKIQEWWAKGHPLPPEVEGTLQVVLPIFHILMWVGIGLLLAALVSRLYWRKWRSNSLKAVEVVLSRDDAADPYQVMGFLDSVYHLYRSRYFWIRWFKGQDHFCFEMAKDKDGVIRLYLISTAGKLEGLKARLQSTYTNITFVAVEGDHRKWAIGYQMKLEKNPYVFTIRTLKDYRLSMIEGMASSWTGVEGQVRVQYVLVPRPLADTHKLREQQEDFEAEHQARRTEDPSDPGLGYVQDKELKGSMEQVGKGLFQVELRIASDQMELAKAAVAAFGEASGANRLLESRMLLRKPLWSYWFRSHMPSILFLPKCVLSTAHMATLFHLPSVRLRGVNFNRKQVRRGTANQAVPRDKDRAVMTDEKGPVAIPETDRKYGVMLLGTQGTGKSTTMLNLIRTDAQNREKAMVILDPKNDLAEDTLGLIPPEREVIYLNIADPNNRVVINPYRNPVSTTVLVSNMMSALSQQFGDDAIGPRSDAFLRNAMYAVLDAIPEEADIFQVYRMLADPDFREVISGRLQDEFQRTYWNHTFQGMAENKRFIEEALAAPRNKLERLLSVDLIKRTLVGNDSVDLRALIDCKGILVVNLAKGLIGEDNAAILGNFLLSAIWQAVQSQAMKPKELRVPLGLFVDEVHNFANPAFEKMLSEGRGFGLQAAVAMQFMGQISDRKVRQAFESLLQNLFVFRTEQLEDAEYYAKVFMRVYGSQIQHNEETQDRLNFGPDDMMNLPVFTALARLVAGGEMQPAFLARTIDTAPFYQKDWSDHHRSTYTVPKEESNKKLEIEPEGASEADVPFSFEEEKEEIEVDSTEISESEERKPEKREESDADTSTSISPWTTMAEQLVSAGKEQEIQEITEELRATVVEAHEAIQEMIDHPKYHPEMVRRPLNTFRMFLRQVVARRKGD